MGTDQPPLVGGKLVEKPHPGCLPLPAAHRDAQIVARCNTLTESESRGDCH
jgi:hypothetical protein